MFKKLLWKDLKIFYGEKDSYCLYPRRYKTRGRKIDSKDIGDTNKGVIVPVSFYFREHQGRTLIVMDEGSVTGYESYDVRDFLKEEKRVGWVALCAGTKNRWDRIEVRHQDIVSLIKEYSTC